MTIKVSALFDVTTSGDWVDITDDVIACSIRRGKNHERDRIEAGTCKLRLKNTDGIYWPNSSSGPYYNNLLPERKIVVQQDWDFGTYDLFTGYIESFQPDWLIKGLQGPVMDITAVDILKVLGFGYGHQSQGWITGYIGPIDPTHTNVSPSTYPEEHCDERIDRILDDMGIATTDREVAASIFHCAAGTTDMSNINALEGLFMVNQVEDGQIYATVGGALKSEPRDHRVDSHNVVEAVFADSSCGFPIYDAHLSYDDMYIFNRCNVTVPGCTMAMVESTSSQDAYGVRVMDATIEWGTTDDNQGVTMANRYISRYADPHWWGSSITIRTGRDPVNLCPCAFGFEISTFIEVALTQASIDNGFWIEGISHDWKATAPDDWQTTWQLTGCSTTWWASTGGGG